MRLIKHIGVNTLAYFRIEKLKRCFHKYDKGQFYKTFLSIIYEFSL